MVILPIGKQGKDLAWDGNEDYEPQMSAMEKPISKAIKNSGSVVEI